MSIKLSFHVHGTSQQARVYVIPKHLESCGKTYDGTVYTDDCSQKFLDTAVEYVGAST